jgi:hypothetical protein
MVASLRLNTKYCNLILPTKLMITMKTAFYEEIWNIIYYSGNIQNSKTSPLVLAAIMRLGRNQKIKSKRILKLFFSFILSWINLFTFYFHVTLEPCRAVGTNGLAVDLLNLEIHFSIYLFIKTLYIFKFGEAHSEAVGTNYLVVGPPNLKKNFKKKKRNNNFLFLSIFLYLNIF